MLALADGVAALGAVECAIAFTGTATRLGPLIIAALIVVAIVSAKLLGLYDRDELLLRKSTLDEAPTVFQLATLFALLVSLSNWQLLHGHLRSPELLAVWALMFFFTLLARWCARHISHRLTDAERCLVVGDASGASAVASRLSTRGGINAVLVGRVELGGEHEREMAMRSLEQTIVDDDVHRVILAPRASDSDVVLDVVRLVKSLGVKVSLLPRLFEVVGSSVVFDDVRGLTVLGVRRFGLTRSSAAIKRSMDVAISAFGLIVLAPVIAMVAILIKIDSAGPVFFRQTRVGRDDRRFSMLKFRSMIADADELKHELTTDNGPHNGELFKLENDPRVTRVGALLRRTALDELPQLFNVLRGDMSVVGPRPLVLDEDALVQGWQRRRLHLTPGMTGPWQVLGSSAPLAEMVNMDYLYIANWSLFSDVKIMLRTALHVVCRRGS
jgi:exopolysaccharide biosynthesis polyprenyl glycosylphosphotransferase